MTIFRGELVRFHAEPIVAKQLRRVARRRLRVEREIDEAGAGDRGRIAQVRWNP